MAEELRLVELARASDVGRMRGHNEDRYLDLPPLLAVADGMGGAQAGEVASAIAVTTMARAADGAGLAPEALREAVEEANREIRRSADANPAQAGMGTTVTAALLGDGRLDLVHVGDSRAYLVRGDQLTRLTEDHSLVEELVRRGDITPEEADRHPQRNVITRALGAEDEVEVDRVQVDLRDGDVLLLCTDGLTTYVSEARVLDAIRAAPSLEAAASALVDLANGAGGVDNVTVLLARLGMAEADAPVVGGGPPSWAEIDPGPEGPARTRADPVTMVGAIPTELLAAAEAAEAQRAAARRQPAPTEDGEAVEPTEPAATPPPEKGDEVMAGAPAGGPSTRPRAAGRAQTDGPDRQPTRAPRRVLEQVGRRRSRKAPVIVAALVILALGIGAAVWVGSRTYFVGVADGQVRVFHGYPASPLGVDLNGSWQETGLTEDLVQRIRAEQPGALDRDARGQGEAVEIAGGLVWRFGLPRAPALTAPVQGPPARPNMPPASPPGTPPAQPAQPAQPGPDPVPTP